MSRRTCYICVYYKNKTDPCRPLLAVDRSLLDRVEQLFVPDFVPDIRILRDIYLNILAMECRNFKNKKGHSTVEYHPSEKSCNSCKAFDNCVLRHLLQNFTGTYFCDLFMKDMESCTQLKFGFYEGLGRTCKKYVPDK